MATKGQRLVAVAAQVIALDGSSVYRRRTKAKVKSVKDLKGMRIGVSAPGPSTHMAVNYMLHKAGLKSVGRVDHRRRAGRRRGGGDAGSGQIDALIVNDPVATILTDRMASLSPLGSMRTVTETSKVFGSDYPESSLFSTKSSSTRIPGRSRR